MANFPTVVPKRRWQEDQSRQFEQYSAAKLAEVEQRHASPPAMPEPALPEPYQVPESPLNAMARQGALDPPSPAFDPQYDATSAPASSSAPVPAPPDGLTAPSGGPVDYQIPESPLNAMVRGDVHGEPGRRPDPAGSATRDEGVPLPSMAPPDATTASDPQAELAKLDAYVKTQYPQYGTEPAALTKQGPAKDPAAELQKLNQYLTESGLGAKAYGAEWQLEPAKPAPDPMADLIRRTPHGGFAEMAGLLPKREGEDKTLDAESGNVCDPNSPNYDPVACQELRAAMRGTASVPSPFGGSMAVDFPIPSADPMSPAEGSAIQNLNKERRLAEDAPSIVAHAGATDTLLEGKVGHLAATGPGAPPSTRAYRGTASDYPSEDPQRWDANGLFGPAAYYTDETRVAGSYADNAKGNTPVLNALDLEDEARSLRAILDGSDARWADDPRQVAYARQRLPQVEADLGAATQGVTVGPNVRAVDIPADLTLLDADATPSLADVNRIRAALADFGANQGQGDGLVKRFDGFFPMVREPDNERFLGRTSNTNLYEALHETFAPIVNHDVGQQKRLANQALSAMGYDGVRYQGGKRIPMTDDATGQPLEHTAYAVFERGMPKVRNALSGQPWGITDALTSTLGNVSAPQMENVAGGVAGAGASQLLADEDETLGERAVRAAGGALGGAAAVRGVKRALRGQNPLALETPYSAETGIRGPGFYRSQETMQATMPLGAAGGEAPSNLERIRTARKASMLSSIATQVFNNLANVTNLAADVGLKPLQAGLDIVTSVKTGQRTRYQAEFGPQVLGSVAGMVDGLREFPDVLAGRLVAGKEVPTGQTASKIDTALEGVFRLMNAFDNLWRSASEGGQAAALATRKATKEGLSGTQRADRAQEILQDLSSHPDIVEEMKLAGARTVFQEDRAELDPLLKVTRGKGGFLTDFVIPFVKTPYNVAAQQAAMSPAGIIATLKVAREGKQGVAVDKASRVIAGTGALGTSFALAAGGYVTGPMPSDPGERSTLPPGWKPFSLRVPAGDGAIYIPVPFFGPFGLSLAAGAVIGDAYRRGYNGEGKDQIIRTAVRGLGKYAEDQLFLDGIVTVAKIVNEPDKWIEHLTEGMAAPIIPLSGFLRQMDQVLDRPVRDPHGPIEAMFAATGPIASGYVQARQTVMGDEQRPGLSGAPAALLGSRVSTEQDEPTLRLFRDARVSVPRQGPTALGLPITESEQRAIQSRAGALMRQKIAPLARDPSFARKPIKDRGKTLEQRRDEAFEQARREVVNKIPQAERSRRQKLRKDAEDQRRPLPRLS